jgi:tetratricopeptide (TPR) repeat protein
MTPTNNLDLQGNFIAFPPAELLVEIIQARLNGSLRLSHEDQKVIVYFSSGEVVFAVSNGRTSRLFDILLRENKIDKKTLSEIPNFTNDMELAKALVEKNLFVKDEIDALFNFQIEDILKKALECKSGEWAFSPLARIKESIKFTVDIHKLLVAYSRNLSVQAVYPRFRSMQEKFSARPTKSSYINLQPHEGFILSRFSDAELTVEEIKMFSGLPEETTLQILYTLWLGGFLTRRNWNAAFTESKIAAILSAHIQLKKEVAPLLPAPIKIVDAVSEEVIPDKTETVETVAEEVISLEDYLERVEQATTHYEVLDIGLKVSSTDIKMAYFGLAKRFHPDHFHKGNDAKLHNRIQTAFSKIAQAYDILKAAETRETYDFKMRKELVEREKMQDATVTEVNQKQQTDLAGENFEQGFSHLMEENYAEAHPFLARAAYLAPDVARYQAYFGKVLSGDSSQRHKAETALQTAIKLEPDNPTYRVMLAEFFIQYNLMKRAEGELNRLLLIFPENREAQNLLDSLGNK